MPWADFNNTEATECTALCRDHLDRALKLSKSASSLEQALIYALSMRVQKSHAVSQDEFDRWDTDYATAMRRVHFDFPFSQDVMALFVEAMMSRTVSGMRFQTCFGLGD
jgi:hypothetical protein